jgi:hypothetical protein
MPHIFSEVFRNMIQWCRGITGACHSYELRPTRVRFPADSLKQHGAAEARRAHNPEVPRSKRGVAKTILFSFF